MNIIIRRWHDYLDMPKHDLVWHKQDIADELQELKEARGIIDKWSELSDICYTYTRALWSGHRDIHLPINYFLYLDGLLYMFPKYILRWNFFYQIGIKFNKNIKITEVRNPKKTEKLKHIARKYNLDEDQFVIEAQKLMKRRFFLK